MSAALGSVRIEALRGDHDCSAFRCGHRPLDTWLRNAAQAPRATGQVFVAVSQGLPAGAYRLRPLTVVGPQGSEGSWRVLKLDRLVRDVRYRGAGLGALLVVDARRRLLAAFPAAPAVALVAEAPNARAEALFGRLGFQRLPGERQRFVLGALTLAVAAEKLAPNAKLGLRERSRG